MTTNGKQFKNSRLPAEWLKMTQSAQEKTQHIVVNYWHQFLYYWHKLPQLHRTGISMLCVFLVVLFFFPANESETSNVKPGDLIVMQPVPDREIPAQNLLTAANKPEVNVQPNVQPQAKPQVEQVVIPITKPVKQPEVIVELNTKPTLEPQVDPIILPPEPVFEIVPDEQNWFTYVVVSGDTLSSIFRDQGVSLQDLYSIAAIEGDDKPLSRIKPKQELRFGVMGNGELKTLEVKTRARNALFVRTPKGNFVRKQ